MLANALKTRFAANRSLRKFKRDLKRKLDIRSLHLKEEIHANSFQTTRFVVFNIVGEVRFIAANLRASFGDEVYPRTEKMLAVWEFEQVKKKQNGKPSILFRLFHRNKAIL